MPRADNETPSTTSGSDPLTGKHLRAREDHERRAEDDAADRAFDRLLRADRRRQRSSAEHAAGVVLRRVADDNRREQQQRRRPARSALDGDEHAERHRRRRRRRTHPTVACAIDVREQHFRRHATAAPSASAIAPPESSHPDADPAQRHGEHDARESRDSTISGYSSAASAATTPRGSAQSDDAAATGSPRARPPRERPR